MLRVGKYKAVLMRCLQAAAFFTSKFTEFVLLTLKKSVD